MPQIDVVPVMKKAPGRCVCCNTTPLGPDNEPAPAIDLNVDVDWGNNAYLCVECVNVICDLWGRVDEDTHNQLLKENKQLGKDHARLRERFKEQREDLKKLVEGQKVEHKVKRRKRKSHV